MTIDAPSVSDLVEGAGLSRPLLLTVSLCMALMVCDSYDVSSLSYAAPALAKAWRLDSATMGLVFSTGLAGLLVGSIVLGRLGDRFGRKRAIIGGALGFSILTAVTGLAHSEPQLLALRFFAAIGLGGAVPNAVALTAEIAPSRHRAFAVAAIFAGYSIGGVLAGLVAARLAPSDWAVLFFAGGAVSLLTTLGLAAWLPESLSYIAAASDRQVEALNIAAVLRPKRPPPALRAKVEGVECGGVGFRRLFAGSLRIATPLMWLIYVANSMTVFALVSWLPLVVERAGLQHAAAAASLAWLFAGSAIGGLAAGGLTDRFGVLAIAAVAGLAAVAVASMGLVGPQAAAILPLLSFTVGALAFGGQTCLHGFVSSLYPTSVRADGVGWAIGVAKVGSILGPIVGGFLLPRLSHSQLFLTAASPLLVVVLGAVALQRTLTPASSSLSRARSPGPSRS